MDRKAQVAFETDERSPGSTGRCLLILVLGLAVPRLRRLLVDQFAQRQH